jgi:hypothetical protein
MFRRGGAGCGWEYGAGAGRMLAFDIETTGVRGGVDRVTCACAYDPDAGVERVFLFEDDGAGARARREEFMGLLDGAPRLCAFNGVRFDAAFLAACWGVPAGRVGGWVRKLVDPFEASKLALGRTFSLGRLLECNGLQGKTGSGLEAVAMARDGRWAELGEYCMHDTRVTHAAASLGWMVLPTPGPRPQRAPARTAGRTSAASQYQSSRAGSACGTGPA